MKKNYIAPYCEVEPIDTDNFIMSSIFDDKVVGGAPDGGVDDVTLPGTTPGGSEPEPTNPDGPIETDAKQGGFFNFNWDD